METKGKKTYYFTATLNPTEYCRDFNPGELHIGNGYVVDIYFNGITIWNPSIRSNFTRVYPFIRETFDLLLSAFIFREYIVSKRIFKLSVNIQRCIEAMKVSAKSNLIWTLDYPTRNIYTPNRNARVNVTWRRVAKYFERINQSTHHKVMLKDYRECINDSGDNAFFFAYRILDDIKNAINFENGISNDQEWSVMHKVLKTDKTFMDSLTEVATQVRHGNLKSMVVIDAKKKHKRKKLLDTAFELMRREFKRKFTGFL